MDWDLREFLIGCFVLLLILAAYAAAGTQDMMDDAAWRESWYEQNEVTTWTRQ